MKEFVQRGDYTTMSQGAIRVLAKRGYSSADVARLLNVTPSYISRVKDGLRSFTLDHLAMLQERTGEKIPLLVLESIPRRSVPKKNLPLYDAAMKMVRDWYEPVEAATKLKSAKKPRRRRVAA